VREGRPSVPEQVDLAIARALEKVPADRFASAKDFADALQGRSVTGGVVRASPKATRWNGGALVGVSIVSLAALVMSVGWWRSAHEPPPPANRFVVTLPPGVSVGGGDGLKVAMSHDGQSLAFSTSDLRLGLRRLDQVEPIFFSKVRPPGPELHFSADGKWLAYWDHGPNKIPFGAGDAGAEPTRLAEAPTLGAIAYFGANLIYLLQNEFFSVPSSGGLPRKLASMDTVRDYGWSRPVMLPDGKTIAFVDSPRNAQGRPGPPRLALISIDDGRRTLLDLEVTGVVGYVDGILVFTLPGRILAVKLDVAARKVVGDPVDMIADHVWAPTRVTVSDNGTLAYLSDASPVTKLEIVDALGNVTSSLPQDREYLDAVFSADRTRIAVTIVDLNQPDIWIYDVESRVFARLTQNGGRSPAWTPDGKAIVFLAKGGAFSMAVDGGTAAEPIPGVSELAPPLLEVEISPDAKYAVLLGGGRPGEGPKASHVTAVPLAGGKSLRILEGAEAPYAFNVSPNGKWIAYESRETRRHEVYIHSFPGGEARLQVSTDGGDEPRWSADGRKLVYRIDKQFREATFDFSGSVPRVIRTDTLFANRNLSDRPISSYNVHPDGKHFIVTRPLGDGTKLVVVTNWITDVRAKLAGK
jgi:serine/threonine-protein kinase